MYAWQVRVTNLESHVRVLDKKCREREEIKCLTLIVKCINHSLRFMLVPVFLSIKAGDSTEAQSFCKHNLLAQPAMLFDGSVLV